MQNKPMIILALMAASVCPAAAQTLPERIVAFDSVMARPAATALANPALSPLRQPVSLSTVSAGFESLHRTAAVTAADGKGTNQGFFRANTFLKSAKATITGHASYSNGKFFDVQGCEVSDPATVYPYYTADGQGGDFRHETYSFGGSYASSFASNWHWGAELNYTALQAYRKVDPRPKNIVGRLNFAAGLGYAFGPHILAIGADATKYKQSNAIMFVSELGESKIYHSTGLGTHYLRFAGTSKSAYYNGWQRGVNLSYASEAKTGAFASASYSRFTLDKVLTDLNHLPLNSIGDNDYSLTGGWRSPRLALSAIFNSSRRTGIENIFGDPAGNVYPMIASYPSFSRNVLDGSISAVWRPVLAASRRLDIHASASLARDCQQYLASEASRASRVCDFSLNAGAQWVGAISRSFIFHGGADAGFRSPFASFIRGIDTNSEFFLDRIALADFGFASSHSAGFSLSAGADWVLPRFCTAGLRLSYSHSSPAKAIIANAFSASINIEF